ncbi:MAG: DUF4393 domain-containing protein [Christensenellaceae bacterium]|nr:DUF4393 domain-containing protein [Christensenellaceae bacterium]
MSTPQDALDALKTAKELLPETLKNADEGLSLLPRLLRIPFSNLEIWLRGQELRRDSIIALLEEKAKAIPEEKIAPIEAYVGVPALQALSYSMDADELRELFANLLASAMNADKKDAVHPAFVEIIKQLSPLDAENMALFKAARQYPIANYALSVATKFGSGTSTVERNVFLANPNTANLPAAAASITNLHRLGMVEIDFQRHVLTPSAYDDFQSTESYKNQTLLLSLIRTLQKRLPDGEEVSFSMQELSSYAAALLAEPTKADLGRGVLISLGMDRLSTLASMPDDTLRKQVKTLKRPGNSIRFNDTIEVEKGIVALTPLGEQFISVCL